DPPGPDPRGRPGRPRPGPVGSARFGAPGVVAGPGRAAGPRTQGQGAVMIDAIRRSWPEPSSEGRRRLHRSPPTRSRTRPPPVSPGAAGPVWDTGPLVLDPLSPSTRERRLRDCLNRHFLGLTVVASIGRGRRGATPRSRRWVTPAPTPGRDRRLSVARSGTA